MGLIIHDDYYEAMCQLPQKQQGEFIAAVVRYGFEGVEPKGTPPWLPVFTVMKKRIELSAKRKSAGAAGGEKSASKRQAKPKQKPSKTQANSEFASTDEPKQNEDVLANCFSRVEDEDEYGVRSIPPIVPQSFALQCLAVLNEVMGLTYSTMPEKCSLNLERLSETYSLEDVRHMIEYKRNEWQGTRYARALTPNTLFSQDHFEQYIHQSKAEEANNDDLAKYDD